MKLEIIAVSGIGEVPRGADIGRLILDSGEPSPKPGDVIVVAQKIVSKAEGRVVAAADRDEVRQSARRQARRIVRDTPQHLIVETHHGFICANAGIDASNTDPGTALLLPKDPDSSARRIRSTIEGALGGGVAVIVSDTFGRPWRLGQTNVAIGSSGIEPLTDYRGVVDSAGRELQVTMIATIDEIASAAEMVMGKVSNVPVAIVRGLQYRTSERGASTLVRPASEDLFR